MKVLFATTNPAKILKYKEALRKNNIDLITLNDLDIKIDIEETGNDALENAYIKARAYFDRTGIPTIGMDNTLFIEELPVDKQPGTHVRRVNGKVLNDEEMITYYTSLVKEYGEKLCAKWIYGMVICTKKGIKKYTWCKDHFYFVSEPSFERNPGYPLDSISVLPEFNKYFLELTKDEQEIYNSQDNKENVVNFIIDSLKGEDI